MLYKLQKYEDNTFGYLNIDGDYKYRFRDKCKVVVTQRNESREEFIEKNHIEFNLNQYGSNLEFDIRVNDSWGERLAMANSKYGLDKLVYDEDVNIRYAVAALGYYLDILIHDKEFMIRTAVANHGYGLDILINDEDYRVRWAVARQDYKLDVLMYDESSLVRETVAQRGYGLDILINDIDVNVRKAAENYCKKEN